MGLWACLALGMSLVPLMLCLFVVVSGQGSLDKPELYIAVVGCRLCGDFLWLFGHVLCCCR